MPDMSLKKYEMPVQAPDVRNTNFEEVALGYTSELAHAEAQRCIQCKNHPCMKGCPVNVNIPGFIKKLQEGDDEGAYEVISATNALPAVCGRVCPQENQCEKYCVRGIKGEPVAIGRLERYSADCHNAKDHPAPNVPAPNGKRVAVIGSGPSSLSCAGDLAKKGYEVTMYEALHTPGGVLVYGIPEFRLPKSIVRREIEGLKEYGVKIETNAVLGRSFSVDDLFDSFGYDAVVLGSGAGLPKFMNIPGVNYNGVFSANEFLTRINLMKAYEEGSETPIPRPVNAVVVGGGNVAMDAARSVKRLGADVTIVYRRGKEELPARKEEVEHAEEEGIKFALLCNPVELLADENLNVSRVRCIRMEFGEPDDSGRKSVSEIPGSEFEIDADCVIMALGTSPNPLIKNDTLALKTNRRGGIEVDESGKTSIDAVYAGGDAVTGAATVILAMGAGRSAAASIDKALSGAVEE